LKLTSIVLFIALPAFAADPSGFALWPAGELKQMDHALSQKVDNQKFASKALERFGNHYTMLAHREGNGSAELHQTEADLFVVESGNATLVVGGDIVGAKTTAPNEVRGTSIKNGTEHKIGPGDIVHIPPKTPHQLLLSGKSFSYFVLKVVE
jgi:mannose-6-phosphate isomerase-like protein (cupin superfamily)